LGIVLGYVTHYLLRRDEAPGAHDLAGIVASLVSGLALDAVGGSGGASAYFVGLAVGFFLYWLALAATCAGEQAAADRPPSRRRGRLFPRPRRPAGGDGAAGGQ
jgi:hypothetical protein